MLPRRGGAGADGKAQICSHTERALALRRSASAATLPCATMILFLPRQSRTCVRRRILVIFLSIRYRAGKFVQVELMIKDRTKYASTKGWGWGRWKGTDLQPYGKSAGFTAECVSCHTPMRDNDFVFTTPIKDVRAPAHIGDLPFNPISGGQVRAGGIND